MTQDEAFLQAIFEDLADDTPWLVYADWLEERGDPRAELYRHRRLTNSVGMQFVLVPPGTFLMGAPEAEAGQDPDEVPQHEVEITRAFYLGAYPVTQEEYRKVTGTNPSYFSSRGRGKGVVKGLKTRRFPVESASWESAVDFCRLLTEKERASGRLYRLPTEAEWEYVCRGGRSVKGWTPFCLDEPTSSLSSTQANFDGAHPYGGAAKGPTLNRTTAVGSYQPNPLGLFDMHGNVWEWCSDWYDARYYLLSPRQDPQGPEASPEGYHVLRGGSYYGPGDVCRSATRNRRVDGGRIDGDGFRVVLVTGAGSANLPG
jgi:uncharacterized protein (TIGR02996 family)